MPKIEYIFRLKLLFVVTDSLEKYQRIFERFQHQIRSFLLCSSWLHVLYSCSFFRAGNRHDVTRGTLARAAPRYNSQRISVVKRRLILKSPRTTNGEGRRLSPIDINLLLQSSSIKGGIHSSSSGVNEEGSQRRLE